MLCILVLTVCLSAIFNSLKTMFNHGIQKYTMDLLQREQGKVFLQVMGVNLAIKVCDFASIAVIFIEVLGYYHGKPINSFSIK